MANRVLWQPDTLQPTFMELYYQQIFEYINNERLKQVEERLIEIGYRFSNTVLLKQFLEEYTTIISFDEKPQYREMYLFYGTDKQMLIAIWWETVQFEHTYDEGKFGYNLKVIAGERP